jgi:hypothetical protein
MDVWLQALVENTAQGIYNELEKLKNLGSSHMRRWVWELCQNAVDSANDKVKIEVELRNDAVIFRHNGHSFEESEIAHLIYHGSTKRGEGGKLGRWGTGFLTTHLLSKLTKVTGVMSDGGSFSFTLDRGGGSAEALKDSMEKSRAEFQNSRTSGSSVKPKTGFTTEYEYPLNQEGLSVALTGIEDLRKIAHYVLALNGEIDSVELVDSKGKKETFIKSRTTDVGDKIYMVRVENKVPNLQQPQLFDIVVVKENNLTIGAGLAEKEGFLHLTDCFSMPKLFVAFPLYGTEDFSFPVIVNCRDFIPTPDRDGIFAGTDVTSANQEDKDQIVHAIQLLFKLLDHALNKSWLDAHFLAQFTKPAAKSWLDTKWYEEQLKTLTLPKLIEARVVCTRDKWITPKDALIPIPGDLDELWNLAAYLYEDKLPCKNLCPSWASIISGWASVLNKKPEEMEQSLTIDKLGQAVTQIGCLQKLESMLKKEEPEAIKPITWLNRFISLLFATNHQQLLDLALLPNENGVFKKRKELRADQGIDEALKDIAKRFGQDIREELLHLQILDDVRKLATPISQDELLDRLLKAVKEQAKAASTAEAFHSANVELFWWLVNNKRYDRLANYPIFCRRTNEKGEESIAYLGGKEIMLAPIERWPEKSRIFFELFPSEYVMSSKYWKTSDAWDILQSQKIILCEPIYSLTKSLGDDVLRESLAFGEQMTEDTEHRIDNVNVSDIAFLKLENRGIIDLVRNSKERARLFIRFLLDFALDFDNSALEPLRLTCSECKEAHSIYTSNWLWVLKTQKWIPVTKGKQETPSAKNLAALLQNQPEMLDILVGDKPSKFFNNLNVSISDIIKFAIAKDEETKLALDNATGRLYKSFSGNTKRLTRLAELIEGEPSIMVELEKKMSDLERVRRNQRVGATVEKIFKELFETNEMKQSGFKIERTGVGSDFALEHDLVENGQEQLLGISKGAKKILIELKTSTENCVRMTTMQGQTAVTNQGNYVLCVVPLGDDMSESSVRDNSRFVLDIGNKLVDKVAKVDELQQKSIEVSSIEGEVGIEVNEGTVRFRVSKQVWDAGRNFGEFLEHLKQHL